MSELIEAVPSLALLVACAFGVVVGSFLNVVIYRLPLILERSWRQECESYLGVPPACDTANAPPSLGLALPRSFCPHCSTPIRPWHNIPVVSYILLRGRCARCGASISPRYPMIEVLTAVVTVVVAWKFGWSWESGAALILSWMLIVLAAIDLEHQLLPDVITLPGVWLGLLISLGGWLSNPESSIVGACTGYLFLWSLFHLFRLVTGKQGMGYGDFKLLAMLGAWLGWQMIPTIVILSSTIGALMGISLILFMGHARNKPIPFGPFLALAGWTALVWGADMNDAYLQWLGIAS